MTEPPPVEYQQMLKYWASRLEPVAQKEASNVGCLMALVVFFGVPTATRLLLDWGWVASGVAAVVSCFALLRVGRGSSGKALRRLQIDFNLAYLPDSPVRPLALRALQQLSQPNMGDIHRIAERLLSRVSTAQDHQLTQAETPENAFAQVNAAIAAASTQTADPALFPGLDDYKGPGSALLSDVAPGPSSTHLTADSATVSQVAHSTTNQPGVIPLGIESAQEAGDPQFNGASPIDPEQRFTKR